MTKSNVCGRPGLALFAGAALLLGLAGSASALTVDEIANYKKPDRQKVLEEGAKKEGELLWTGGLNEKTASRPILDAFMKKYPYIKAKSVRTGTAEGLQRVLAENRAKTPRIDIINANVVLDLKNAHLAQPFYSPLLDQYPAEFKDPGRMYATLRYSYQGVAAWNTNNTKKEDAPKKYEDLLDPKWKGKMVVASSDETGITFMITYLRKVWGEKKTADYLAKLAKQNIVTRSESARNIIDQVAAGEYPIMINPALHHVAGLRKKGGPVDASMESPVLARNGYFVLLTTAPHPHASMLLIDFMLDKEAQGILRDAQYYPAHPGVDPVPAMMPYLPRAHGMKQFTADDETLFKETKASDALYQKLFIR